MLKQPSYQKNRKQPEIIYEETYRGRHIVVTDIGVWPNFYVENYNGFIDIQDFNELEREETIARSCTYVGPFFMYLGDKKSYLGFSLSHSGDWAGYYDDREPFAKNAKKWTTEEIIEQARKVVDFCIQFDNQKYYHTKNVVGMAHLTCPIANVVCMDCWRYKTNRCNRIKDAQFMHEMGYGDLKLKLLYLKETFETRKSSYDRIAKDAKESIKTEYAGASSALTDVIKDIDNILEHFND